MSQAKLTLRPPPHEDFLRGYPGIPPSSLHGRSQACLCGTVEVRKFPRSTILASKLVIELKKVETIPDPSAPANLSSSSTLPALLEHQNNTFSATAVSTSLHSTAASTSHAAFSGGGVYVGEPMKPTSGTTTTASVANAAAAHTAAQGQTTNGINTNSNNNSSIPQLSSATITKAIGPIAQYRETIGGTPTVLWSASSNHVYDEIPTTDYEFSIPIPEGVPHSVCIDSTGLLGVHYELVATLSLKPKRSLLKSTKSGQNEIVESTRIYIDKHDLHPAWPHHAEIANNELWTAKSGGVWLDVKRATTTFGPGDSVWVRSVLWTETQDSAAVKLHSVEVSVLENVKFDPPLRSLPGGHIRTMCHASHLIKTPSNPNEIGQQLRNKEVHTIDLRAVIPSDIWRVSVNTGKHVHILYTMRVVAKLITLNGNGVNMSDLVIDNIPVKISSYSKVESETIVNRITAAHSNPFISNQGGADVRSIGSSTYTRDQIGRFINSNEDNASQRLSGSQPPPSATASSLIDPIGATVAGHSSSSTVSARASTSSSSMGSPIPTLGSVDLNHPFQSHSQNSQTAVAVHAVASQARMRRLHNVSSLSDVASTCSSSAGPSLSTSLPTAPPPGPPPEAPVPLPLVVHNSVSSSLHDIARPSTAPVSSPTSSVSLSRPQSLKHYPSSSAVASMSSISQCVVEEEGDVVDQDESPPPFGESVKNIHHHVSHRRNGSTFENAEAEKQKLRNLHAIAEAEAKVKGELHDSMASTSCTTADDGPDDTEQISHLSNATSDKEKDKVSDLTIDIPKRSETMSSSKTVRKDDLQRKGSVASTVVPSSAVEPPLSSYSVATSITPVNANISVNDENFSSVKSSSTPTPPLLPNIITSPTNFGDMTESFWKMAEEEKAAMHQQARMELYTNCGVDTLPIHSFAPGVTQPPLPAPNHAPPPPPASLPSLQHLSFYSSTQLDNNLNNASNSSLSSIEENAKNPASLGPIKPLNILKHHQQKYGQHSVDARFTPIQLSSSDYSPSSVSSIDSPKMKFTSSQFYEQRPRSMSSSFLGQSVPVTATSVYSDFPTDRNSMVSLPTTPNSDSPAFGRFSKNRGSSSSFSSNSIAVRRNTKPVPSLKVLHELKDKENNEKDLKRSSTWFEESPASSSVSFPTSANSQEELVVDVRAPNLGEEGHRLNDWEIDTHRRTSRYLGGQTPSRESILGGWSPAEFGKRSSSSISLTSLDKRRESDVSNTSEQAATYWTAIQHRDSIMRPLRNSNNSLPSGPSSRTSSFYNDTVAFDSDKSSPFSESDRKHQSGEILIGKRSSNTGNVMPSTAKLEKRNPIMILAKEKASLVSLQQFPSTPTSPSSSPFSLEFNPNLSSTYEQTGYFAYQEATASSRRSTLSLADIIRRKDITAENDQDADSPTLGNVPFSSECPPRPPKVPL